MGFKDILTKMKEKQNQRKEMMRQADLQLRIQQTLEERQKSANERELERFHKEDREEQIKVDLDIARMRRSKDIALGHNPINTKNIMKAEWEIMKEKNMFKGRSTMFSDQDFIHKNNPNLLKNNMKLLKGGNI